MRRVWVAAIVGIVLLSAVMLYFISSPSSANSITVTYSHPGRVDFTGGLPAIIAKEKGFWREQGLDVNLIWFRGGGEQMRAVASKEIEISTSTPNMIATLVSRGEKVKIIASISRPVPRTWGIMVLTDSPLKTVQDLKGKVVGATTRGAYSDMLVRLLLEEAGLKPDQDVTLTYLGTADALASALASRTVDAAIGWPGLAEVMEVQLNARQLVSAADYLPDWEDEVWFASESLIRERPDVALKALRGWYKAVAWMKQNREEVVRISMEQYQWSKELAEKVYDSNIMFLSDDGLFKIEALELASRKTFELGLSDYMVPVKDLFTEQFVPVLPP